MALAQPPIVLTWRSAATIQLRSRSVCCSIITFQAGCDVVAHFGTLVWAVSCFCRKIELGSAPQAQPPMQRHVDWSARRLGPSFSRGNVTISATTRATKVCSIVISGTCPVARKVISVVSEECWNVEGPSQQEQQDLAKTLNRVQLQLVAYF